MIEKLKKILENKKINLILFGETHGFLDDNSIQEEIIKIFKPTIFLYEMLEETNLFTIEEHEEFLKQPDEKDFSVISIFGELKKTVALANKHNLPIVGSDIRNMCRENKDFLKKTELSKEEMKIEEDILKKREERQVQEMLSHLKKGKKVLATTGAFHLRQDSPLLNLKENYLIIYPTYNGEQIFTPPENFDIKSVTFDIKEIS